MVSSRPIERGLRAALLAIGLAGLLASAATPAQPRDATLDPADAALVGRWLRSSCLGEEAATLESRLRDRAAVLAPVLRRALADGPPAAEIAAVREAAAQRHARRANFDWSGMAVTGIDRTALARVQREPARTFVDGEARRFVDGWRANAIAGLAIVGAPVDRATLRRIGARSADPLAPAAREALRKLAPR
jgi:hypothetical protein